MDMNCCGQKHRTLEMMQLVRVHAQIPPASFAVSAGERIIWQSVVDVREDIAIATPCPLESSADRYS